jgi:glycosyltransferase involved in cell wall biosynthesis
VSIGAVASVISDRVDGLLMKPNDANDLSEKLLELASNPELRKTFGIMDSIKQYKILRTNCNSKV